MDTLTITLKPLTAFGGPIYGDTLFGQLCWAIRNRHGEARLSSLLEGYTDGRPFAVISDAFPDGYLPRPVLPLPLYNRVPDEERKRLKKRAWLPLDAFDHPIPEWLAHCQADTELAGGSWLKSHAQPHNSLNRLTGTTGKGDFAPYTLPQQWFSDTQALQLYICHDPQRITVDDLVKVLEDVGTGGYGRDASIGLGKFAIESKSITWPAQPKANCYLTLAACAPQGMGFLPEHSWYQPFTRFGRHGDLAVHRGNPFKAPLLLAAAGGLFKLETYRDTVFIGQGLGGDGQLSRNIRQTVHQGYAPVLGVQLPTD